VGHYLDLDAWARRAQFDFFRDFDLPFYNVCAEVDVTALRRWCTDNRRSFFAASWFALQQAANRVEAFRCRLRDDRVWVHDQIGLNTVVANDDGETFRFLRIPHAEDLGTFERGMEDAQATDAGPDLGARPEDDAVIHGTTLPWIRFTSLSHARRFDRGDSVPKIALGKRTNVGEQVLIPLSVEVHHALVDGVHVGRFYECFEGLVAEPSKLV